MSRARDNADLGNSYGVLGAGVTGGSGLNPVSEMERTSLTSPNTITATCTLGDTLDSAGSISADLFGSSNVTLFGGVNQTNAAITFDYGSGVTKYLRYIKWLQVDGGGNSTGIKIRASDNGTSWTDITTITSAIVNGTNYSFANTGTTAYRYWQVQYTWSSANRGLVKDFIIHESDVSSVTNISPATTFPAKHTKITTITNDTEVDLSNATSNYETIGSHTKDLASSVITAMVCMPIVANVTDGMWTVPILELQYGGTLSAVQTGSVFGSTGMAPQITLYGTWTGKSAGNHDLKWGWDYGSTNSKPGITTWNPDETIDHRMSQSATYAIVMEIFV
tara:strand:+ start:65 stop:1069 length:1005 start_codon:yes stop_codon:yes gene_type:complete